MGLIDDIARIFAPITGDKGQPNSAEPESGSSKPSEAPASKPSIGDLAKNFGDKVSEAAGYGGGESSKEPEQTPEQAFQNALSNPGQWQNMLMRFYNDNANNGSYTGEDADKPDGQAKIPGKLEEASDAKNRRSESDRKEQEDFDYSEELTNFMNSDNPYAQAYLRANNINPGSFNWHEDYGDFAAEGGKDAWSAMVTSSPEMKQAYMEDYGRDIDFNGDKDISAEEAGQWWQNMKDQNQVENLDFTNTDDQTMQRIFGGLGGQGMDNDLIDAINMIQTQAVVSSLLSGKSVDDIMKSGIWQTPYASDTGDTYASTIGLLDEISKLGEEGADSNSSEYGDKVARLNNSMKLIRLMDAADENRKSGEKRTVIDFGDDPEEYANQLSALISNVAGGDSGLTFSNENRAVGDDRRIYDTATGGSAQSDATALGNALINSGGKDISDDLSYLLLNYLGAGNGMSLADRGYGGLRSSGEYEPAPPRTDTLEAVIGALTRNNSESTDNALRALTGQAMQPTAESERIRSLREQRAANPQPNPNSNWTVRDVPPTTLGYIANALKDQDRR